MGDDLVRIKPRVTLYRSNRLRIENNFKLGILSRDAEQYAQLITQRGLADINLSFACSSSPAPRELKQIDLLLAEPKLAANVLTHCENLRWLQSTWAGNQPLLIHPKQNYLLSGVKDVFQQAMSEYVLTYLLHFSRNVEVLGHLQQHKSWQPKASASLASKKIGILGVGNIGQGLAKTLQYFGMQVRGLSNKSRDCIDVDQYYDWANIADFCHELDFIVCLLPHTQLTEGIINHKVLAHLPAHCVLINAGRGQTLVEQDLIKVLKQKRLKAAVLDVFSIEPLAADNPLWHTKNVYITQHTAAESQPHDIADIFFKNFSLFKQHLPLHGALSFAQGY